MLRSLLVAVLMILSVIASVMPAHAAQQPYGTKILAATDWLGGAGVDVYANGSSSYVSNDYSAPAVGMKWQCVELAQRLYKAKGWHGGLFANVSVAADIYDQATNLGMTRTANGSITSIVPGDMIVHGAAFFGGAGHVDVVDSISGSTVNIVEQNFSYSGRATYTLSNGSLSRSGTSDIKGVVHDPDNKIGASGVGTRLLGDVNGDSKDDAVVMFRDSGTAMVALSTGNSFAAPSSWSYLHTVGADKYFLADVNGDNKADMVAFWTSNGRWRVSPSSGSGFWPETEWAYGHGVGTSKQFLAKVNADDKADVVTYDQNTGDWWVSTSSGSGFWSPVRWISGHGIGSTDQQFADFTGDGKADAGVWFSSGAWYVAASNGNGFNGYSQWSAGHGVGSDRRLTADTNGDLKADAAYFFASNGHWDVGTSAGSGFWAPTAWAHGHGVGTTEQFLAKVSNDNMADVVTFDRNTGDWWVSTSSGSGFWSPVRWISGHGTNS